MSRRSFVGASAGMLAALASGMALPRVTLARDYRSAQKDVLVVCFLRGGADGLSMCVPFGDPAYYTSRPKLAIPRPDSSSSNRCIALDSYFGLPQAMASLVPAYQAGKLLFVQATGCQDGSRSHFRQQRWMEVGKLEDLSLNTGWLGRHLASVNPKVVNALVRAVAISDSVPRSMLGAPLAVAATPKPENFGIPQDDIAALREGVIRELYASSVEPLVSTAGLTFDTAALLRSINFNAYQPAGGAAYTTEPIAHGLRAAAALIKAQIGVEAISLDMSGWDTHFDQSPMSPSGYMYKAMVTLSNALAAFFTDMTAASAPSFTLVCMSEFGRRVVENASIGTDHGHGGMMMVMGSSVIGGRVLANWPGLGQGQLFEGLDLQITTDYRDILGEILARRMGADNLAPVFPGFTPTFRGVVS